METKITSLDAAICKVRQWQSEGKKVGFTNGCFDLLHSGHLKSFHYTRQYCDKLVVAVNNDASVKKLKGETRPINDETERSLLLEALFMVDMVVIFGEGTPIKLIEALRPDVLAKGEDYQIHQVVGHEIVESYGGKVVLVPLKAGHSTTNTLKKMQ